MGLGKVGWMELGKGFLSILVVEYMWNYC